jgi:Protein of unknown function (DUF3037)
MAEKRRLEFFVLRYAPDTISDEFMNIGIVLLDPTALLTGFCDARFIADWQRVESFDEDADIEMLRATASDIEEQLKTPVCREYLLRMMEDSFSNAIQLSPRRECVTEDPSSEIESLAHRYLQDVMELPDSMTRPSKQKNVAE